MAEQIIERVALNFTDLTGKKTGCTTLGSNKFWVGMVVKNDDGTFDYRCQWGSTGTEGKTTGSKYDVGEDKAHKLLAAKVKSKKKKGYTELQTRSKDEETAKAAAQGVDLTSGKKAKPKKVKAVASRQFHQQVDRLLGIIYGKCSATVRSGLSNTAGATEDNPIGNLSDSQLDTGGGILDEIQKLLGRKLGNESRSNKDTELPLLRSGVPSETIIDLTNEFMSNVPREIDRKKRGKKNLHSIVISSYARLEDQRKFLQLLRDAHLSQATFQAAAAQKSSGSKAAVWYDGLDCGIEYLESGSKDRKWAEQVFNTAQSRQNANWFRNGRCVLRVKNVWRFSRKGTEARFDAYAAKMKAKRGALGNIFAWHGTGDANLLGISKSGLLMPENLPRGIHISGKAFGKGIYHAPVVNTVPMIEGHRTDGTNGALKSMNYTSAQGAYYGSSNTSKGAFMYLQEVSLGRGDVYTSPCWDRHRPRNWPKNDYIYANAGGCSSLSHDELVTFDEDAQMFRYLLEIEVC